MSSINESRRHVSAYPQAIEACFRVHPDAHQLTDEWGGVTNPVLRRKLQNRLNQRAARRRKAALDVNERHTPSLLPAQYQYGRSLHSHPIETTAARARRSQRCLTPSGSEEDENDGFRSFRKIKTCKPLTTVLLQDRLSKADSLYERIMVERDSRAVYPLPADHLLTLVYYNVYRALIQNAAVLNLDLGLMSSDDYESPFAPYSATSTLALRILPPALQPTKLQRTIAHHPQWDLIPNPRVRDNILRYEQQAEIDDVDLCLDLIGTESRRQKYHRQGSSHAGCIVWGDPWDVASWEVTEAFVRKYPWMHVGTSDLEASTNKHRVKRGEYPISWDELGVPCDDEIVGH